MKSRKRGVGACVSRSSCLASAFHRIWAFTAVDLIRASCRPRMRVRKASRFTAADCRRAACRTRRCDLRTSCRMTHHGVRRGGCQVHSRRRRRRPRPRQYRHPRSPSRLTRIRRLMTAPTTTRASPASLRPTVSKASRAGRVSTMVTLPLHVTSSCLPRTGTSWQMTSLRRSWSSRKAVALASRMTRIRLRRFWTRSLAHTLHPMGNMGISSACCPHTSRQRRART